jgi:hypothetical protein
LTDSPIPWPTCRTTTAVSDIFFATLARAIRRESNLAVTRAWGASGQAATKRRKAFGVPTITKGTSAQNSDLSKHPPGDDTGGRRNRQTGAPGRGSACNGG